MPLQQNTTNGILTRYERRYRKGAEAQRVYDQLAGAMMETFVQKGTTITAAMTSDMVVRPTGAVASMIADFDPQTIDDVTASITVDMYMDGLKAHQKVNLTHFDNMSAIFAEKVGKNMMQTVDTLAARAATQGDLVLYPGSHVTRATLDGATATDILIDDVFAKASVLCEHWTDSRFVDGSLAAILGPFAYADLLRNSSGNLITIGKYTEHGKQILLNGEIGTLQGFRLVRTPRARTFWGAGAARGSAAATTLSADAKAGATTVTVAANTNLVVGQWMHIGTPQTGAASDANEITEPVLITKISGTTITFVGSGPFNGLKYAHDSGATVTNKYSVHTVVLGGKYSLVKAYASELGEYGELVKPFETGNAKQWTNWSWKWFGGYGRVGEGNIIRIECANAQG